MEQHKRLKSACQMAGYDMPTDASRAFGWKQATYLAHENGTRGLRPKTAEKYAQAFGVSAAGLLTNESEPQSRENRCLRAIRLRRLEYDRHVLLQAIESSFECLAEIDKASARQFAESVLELAEQQQAHPEAQRTKDLFEL